MDGNDHPEYDVFAMQKLIPKHGGYRQLKTFQLGQLIYDVTVRFCDRWVRRGSRTHDQMVQAARSGVQNIAEGSQASGTSKKTELKLTNVARASLEELVLDYEDFLRQSRLPLWDQADARRKELVSVRPKTADEVALWVKDIQLSSGEPMESVAANAVLVLLGVCCYLLSKQINSLADDFKRSGGFTERLYHYRKAARRGS